MDPKYIALVLKEYADEINNNEFDNLYENFQMKSSILTSYLLKAGIDPLQTLGWAPEDYARGFLTVTEAHINDDVVTYLLKNHDKYGIQMKPIDQKYWWLPDQPDYDLGWFDPVKFNKWS